MRLLSVNVGMPAKHVIDGKEVTTGIFKWPVPGRSRVGRLAIAGDGHANQPNHGGLDQALSAYSIDHYRFWAARFSRDDFSYGVFGENLTVDGMNEAEMCIGDVLEIGSTILQVTHPRIPCFRLSYRLGIPKFHQEQLECGKIGYLLRVLQEGEIAAGDAVRLVERENKPITVAQCIAATLLDRNLPDVLDALDRLPHLSARWRAQVTARRSRASVIAMHGAAQRSLSASAVEVYQRDGIVFPVAALPAARVRQLRQALEAVETGLGAKPTPMRWTNLCFSWAYDITMEPAVLDSVEALLGPEIIVMGSIVLSKHPGHDAYVGWHQDSVTGAEEPAPAVSAWIAVTDSTPANGCMRVIPATHHTLLPHHEVADPANLLRAGRVLAEPVDEAQAVDVELRAGEMSLHHDRIVHGSRPNCGDGKRIGFVVRYTTPAARSRGFPVVRARGRAACPQLELVGRPPEAEADAAFATYLAFTAATERAIARRNGTTGGPQHA